MVSKASMKTNAVTVRRTTRAASCPKGGWPRIETVLG